MLGYFIPAFLIPILYGSWRCTIYHILAGPLLAFTLTDNMNEWPAVWCLMSIGLILLVAKTPVRRFLYVQQWWFWGSPNIIQYTEAEITPQFLVKGD
jgi:hypothetical protein